MTDQAMTAQDHAGSNATRLLCAGTYLDRRFGGTVINELLTNWYRFVAPSYGYDAVPVLAHALAARNLRRNQLRATVAGAAALVLLEFTGIIGFFGGLFLFVWLAWAVAFLRRVATMQTLIAHLGPARPGGRGFDGRYPASKELTPELVRKISFEQANSDTIHYGGFYPFVGAGDKVHDWSSSELLLGAVPNPLLSHAARGPYLAQDVAPPPIETERKAVKAFTVDEITKYVQRRLIEDLRDDARDGERIEQLTVERRRYGTALVTVGAGWRLPPTPVALPQGLEDYRSAREYLCIRVGSWDQELVTSMFVGFDLKGNTLHSEFYTHELRPIIKGFHLVDQLPEALSARILRSLAWDAVRSAPTGLSTATLKPVRKLRLRPWTWRRKDKTEVWLEPVVDGSEFRLGRYANGVLDRGARVSVRQLAASAGYHHFFQRADTIKYTRIVERRLLQIVGDFLTDKDVDLSDHNARQANILNQNFGLSTGGGSVTLTGNGNTLNSGPAARQEPK